MKLRSRSTQEDGRQEEDSVKETEHDPSPVDNEGEDKPLKPPIQYINMFGVTMNKVVFIVHLNIAIYAACFFIQVGTLPYLSKKLGVNPVLFGYLQTTFAVVQLTGGPLFGRFGDIYGGCAALVLAFSSATVTYALMAVAVNIPILFLSRLPSIFMHAMQGGQMVVTDMSASAARADALGKLGLSYGIGMVTGPFIGGLITKNYGEEVAAGVACLGSIISVMMCVHYIPHKTKLTTSTQEAEEGTQNKTAAIFNLSKLMSLVNNRRVAVLLAVRMVSGIPIGIFQSMFSIVAMETFKLAADQNGYILSYVGAISMVTQGIGIQFLLKQMTEMNIIKLAAFILVWSYLLLALIQTVVQLCLVLIPMCIGLTLMSVVISSALTHTVQDTDTGAMLGLNMAVNSLIRTLSPTVGGLMLAAYGFPSIGYLGFFNSMLITVFMVARRL